MSSGGQGKEFEGGKKNLGERLLPEQQPSGKVRLEKQNGDQGFGPVFLSKPLDTGQGGGAEKAETRGSKKYCQEFQQA